MSTIVTRGGKGSALTHAEVDANFVNLNTDKVESGGNTTFTGTNTFSGANSFTGANTFTNATGQIFRQAATQDGILLRGRAGGATSRTVELVPDTLTASRTLTAPDSSGTIALNESLAATDFATTGSIKSSGTGGVGYATGAGASVTQLTSRTTAVTINAICGRITLFSKTTTADQYETFTVNNSTVAATDVIVLTHQSGGTAGRYFLLPSTVSAGSFQITVHTQQAQGTAAAPVINFAVIKAVNA